MEAVLPPSLEGYDGVGSDPSGLGDVVPYYGAAVNGDGDSGLSWRAVEHISPVAGALGDAADVAAQKSSGEIGAGAAAAAAAGILVGLGLRFAAGYFVGKALAPSEDAESRYAWGGAVAGTFLGVYGLAGEAVISMAARR